MQGMQARAALRRAAGDALARGRAAGDAVLRGGVVPDQERLALARGPRPAQDDARDELRRPHVRRALELRRRAAHRQLPRRGLGGRRRDHRHALVVPADARAAAAAGDRAGGARGVRTGGEGLDGARPEHARAVRGRRQGLQALRRGALPPAGATNARASLQPFGLNRFAPGSGNG